MYILDGVTVREDELWLYQYQWLCILLEEKNSNTLKHHNAPLWEVMSRVYIGMQALLTLEDRAPDRQTEEIILSRGSSSQVQHVYLMKWSCLEFPDPYY